MSLLDFVTYSCSTVRLHHVNDDDDDDDGLLRNNFILTCSDALCAASYVLCVGYVTVIITLI